MRDWPRVLITGGGGQLARALLQSIQETGGAPRVQAPTRTELDITNPRSVREAVSGLCPDWIVNCAAYTAVDAAEDDAARAYQVNDEAVGDLADTAHDAGIRLMHISTDYVFDGSKSAPYVEDDPTNPLNVYGASKLAGEKRLQSHPARSLILRTAWVYGEGQRNFLGKIVERGREALLCGEDLEVVSDQVGCPTDVHTLARQIGRLILEDSRGLYHAASTGEASWYEFAQEIFAGLGLHPRLVAIPGSRLTRPARRASRVILENRKLETEGTNLMLHWKDGLHRVLERLKKS